MQKLTTVKLSDDKLVEIRELRLKDVVRFGAELTKLTEHFNLSDLGQTATEIFTIVTSLQPAEVLDLTFTDLELVEAAFKEVNAPFLRRYAWVLQKTQALGLQAVLQQVLTAIREDYLAGVSRVLKSQKTNNELPQGQSQGQSPQVPASQTQEPPQVAAVA